MALLSALLVGLAPVAIAWSIVRRRHIDVQTVLGALCIYVLLGMFWAFAFAAIGAFGSDPFFAQEASPTSASYLYFAYVTLTTVGYGDLTASGNLGRALAVLDALLGQIYLVTVVALLVSQLGRTSRHAATSEHRRRSRPRVTPARDDRRDQLGSRFRRRDSARALARGDGFAR